MKKPEDGSIFQWADDSYQTRQVAGTLKGLVPGNTGNKLINIVYPTETAFLGVEVTVKNRMLSLVMSTGR